MKRDVILVQNPPKFRGVPRMLDSWGEFGRNFDVFKRYLDVFERDFDYVISRYKNTRVIFDSKCRAKIIRTRR
jgi:hypothetical protein